MTAALYGTIWLALVLFALGETGKRGHRAGRAPQPWAWWAFAIGCGVAIVHVAIAMGAVHGWSHAAAMEATARQTEAVVGVNWGGGVYVNYAFVLAWACETVYWRWNPAGYAARPRALVWGVRAFYFVIILNAAVVFAAAPRRAAGLSLVLWLLAIWWPGRRAGTGSGV